MDRLKLVKFPPTAVFAVRTAIERSWLKGIQKEKDAATGQTEIQFRGNPWSGQGDDACPALNMICEVMASLYHLGWNLIMCTDISKRAVSSTPHVVPSSSFILMHPLPCSSARQGYAGLSIGRHPHPMHIHGGILQRRGQAPPGQGAK